jgi:hypothetical protein
MANQEKSLREYSAPSTNQVPTGPKINTGNGNFEIKIGNPNEDVSAHLQ